MYKYLCISLLLFVACKKEVQPPAKPQESEEISTLKTFLGGLIETSKDSIVYDPKHETFIIEGDMMMSLKNARDYYDNPAKEAKTAQRFGPLSVSSTNAPHIGVYLNVPDEWLDICKTALEAYNQADILIKFQIVTDVMQARLFISTENEPSKAVYGRSILPDNLGNPGSDVVINLAYSDPLSRRMKQHVVMHELGHTIGFRHTDAYEGDLVSETPDQIDTYSIMNMGISPSNLFSYYDHVAFGIIYPNFPGTKHLLRFHSSDYNHHYYTLNSAETPPSTFVLERGNGYLYAAPTTGTTPLYRYYKASTHDYLYTSDYNEIGGGGWGYVFQGIVGYLYATQITGTRPLYRYYNNVTDEHFLTTDFSEIGSGNSEWNWEWNVGYVY